LINIVYNRRAKEARMARGRKEPANPGVTRSFLITCRVEFWIPGFAGGGWKKAGSVEAGEKAEDGADTAAARESSLPQMFVSKVPPRVS
jgi:hypothetical protein